MFNKFFNINKYFIKGFLIGFSAVAFAMLILFGIDAHLCAQERADLQEQHCLFSVNCR